MSSESYGVGDTAPYVNTRGNVAYAEIDKIDFNDRNGRKWFTGTDVKTGANVFYPIYKSKQIGKKTLEEFMEEHGLGLEDMENDCKPVDQ